MHKHSPLTTIIPCHYSIFIFLIPSMNYLLCTLGTRNTFHIKVAHSGKERISPTWSIAQFWILTKMWLFKD